MIQNIFQLMEYRESADPAYPEAEGLDLHRRVPARSASRGKRLKIGVGGYLVSNPIQLAGLKECYPEAEIVRADDVMVALRSIKSDNEIACIREGLRITEIATQEVIRHIRPGMTELQLVGIAQKTIYENGAEYEGLPMYVFSEKSTRHAISRSTYREIQPGDIVQLNLSAKVDGYSPSIGMPISMGRLAGGKGDRRVRPRGPPLDVRPVEGRRDWRPTLPSGTSNSSSSEDTMTTTSTDLATAPA